MPGFSFAYRESGASPLRKTFPLAKSMTGTGTPPAATLKNGDVVAYTTVSALTTSSAKVMRMVLAADKTANYEEGGVRCGIFGILGASDTGTNSSARAVSAQSNGGAISRTPSMSSMNPLDSNGHAQETFIAATPDTVFKAQLTAAAASAAAYLALKGGLAGLTITTTSGVSVYTVDSTITGEGALFIIKDVDPNDSTFKTVFVKVITTGLTPTGTYCQNDNGVPYSTQ
jgi:hypothetical protein